MNKKRSCVVVFLLMIVLSISFNSCSSFFNEKCNTELRDELRKMGRLDQNVRIRNSKVILENRRYLEKDEIFLPKERMDREGRRVFDEIRRVDEENTRRLKEIVDEYGWPSYSLVGKKASNCA